jgi:chromosomal replication initiation ATPase DnaA
MERTMSDIGLIALKHGLQREDLLGRNRKEKATRARQEAYYKFRYKGWSYRKIGKLFGRDHKTVVSGFEKHKTIAFAMPDNVGVTSGLI